MDKMNENMTCLIPHGGTKSYGHTFIVIKNK